MTREKAAPSLSGWTALTALVPALALCLAVLYLAVDAGSERWLALAVPGAALCILLLAGLRRIRPGEARVLRLFGRYAGSVRTPGLRWMNPLFTSRRVPIDARVLETSRLRLADVSGGEVEVIARISWRVADTAVAAALPDWERAVREGTEEAIVSVARRRAAVAGVNGRAQRAGTSMRIAQGLKTDLQFHLAGTGVEIREARIVQVVRRREKPVAPLEPRHAAAIVNSWQEIVDQALETA